MMPQDPARFSLEPVRRVAQSTYPDISNGRVKDFNRTVSRLLKWRQPP